jgi:hypothetical protein
MDTIFLPEDSTLINRMFGLFDDIIALEENSDCSVAMNNLKSCDEYQFLQQSSFEVEDCHITYSLRI